MVSRDSGAMGTLSPAPLGPRGPVLLGEMGGFSVHCSETRRDPDPPCQGQLCPFLWPRSIVHKWCVTETELYNILWYTSRQWGTVQWNSDGVLDLSQIPLGCRPSSESQRWICASCTQSITARERPRTGSQVKHLQQARHSGVGLQSLFTATFRAYFYRTRVFFLILGARTSQLSVISCCFYISYIKGIEIII